MKNCLFIKILSGVFILIDTEKQYSISEVSDITGYEAHVLRYYEKEFDLEIPRNEANHRYYTFKELETLNYIKSLQDKGFTNKQIKLILNSPEILVNSDEEAAVTTISKNEIQENSIEKINMFIEELILREIKPIIIDKESINLNAINELKDEILGLREEINSKERDVLICENAKLKMKIKEKSYQVAELKEKIKRDENSKKSLFKKIFK